MGEELLMDKLHRIFDELNIGNGINEEESY